MVYVHLAEGFEEIEALTVIDVLRRADIDTMSVSMTGEKLVRGTHGINVEADIIFEDADYDGCGMIVLPGGLPGADHLMAHKDLNEKIDEFIAKGKKLAAICAAPMVLGSHESLAGKTATVYPGMESRLGSLIPISVDTIQDGNVITGKGPALAMKFALAIVEDLKGEEAAKSIADGLLFNEV